MSFFTSSPSLKILHFIIFAHRSRTPYMVNPLIAGYDTETGKVELKREKTNLNFAIQPELYFMDYLAAMIQTK